MTQLSEQLRQAMRQWATGVTIVSASHAGQRHGMTVSSFTSVSLEPPMVLVSLEQSTHTHRMIQVASYFGITILTRDMQEISDRFAGRMPDNLDRFAGLETFTLSTGSPLLASGLAWFDCRVVATYPAGNHTVFIGMVEAVKTGQDSAPLLYYDRRYRFLENL
jgi:flavin reductase (DIM6/NTAB) family NADH-FMN oxidoreductase RutF